MRVIAFMNQKGGVGKATPTVNLAAGIAALGSACSWSISTRRRTLRCILVWMPRALDALPEDRRRSAYDVLIDPTIDARSAPRPINENLAVLPAETDLAGVETELADVPPAERTTRLRQVLETLTAPGAGWAAGIRVCADRLPAVAGCVDAERSGRGA